MYADISELPSGGRRSSLALRLLVAALDRLHCGELRLHGPDGRVYRMRGSEAGPWAVIRLHDPALVLRRLMRGDLGFAEAYMDGAWDTPDLAALLELGALNETALRGALGSHALVRAWQGLRHRLRDNSRRGSRRNIAYHYDLGNDFYRLWLDPGMSYSSALFSDEAQPLEDAQRAKNQRLISLLGLRPEHHLLEIGCGWGGFAIEAARTSGCRVTGLTLSTEQLEWARRRVRDEGLQDRIDLRLQDYRDVGGEYDRIASVEMFEAVGEARWPTYFRTLRDRLRPGGRAALQVITIDEGSFQGYRDNVDFIQRYIFPGGMLPSPTRLAEEIAGAGLIQRDTDFFGADYARTLAHWERRVLDARVSISALGFGGRFLRMWLYYLAYCQAGFRTGRIDLEQTLLERPAA